MKRYQLFSEYSRDIALYMRSNGQILEANEAALEAYGYDREELLSLTIADLRDPTTQPILAVQLRQAIASGILFETRHRRKNGEVFPVEVSAQSTQIDGEEIILSIIRDITVRKQAEAELEQLLEREQAARAEAEAANRVKDEFLAVLSHELRTPLNPILGWVTLLRSHKLDDQTTAQALEIIERNVRLQAQLVDDLLDISRIFRGKLLLNVRPVNLVDVVTAAIETMQLAAAAKAIEIHTSFDAGGTVRGDAERLQQVVWNLLSNAIKFTPEAGQITIRLTHIDRYAQIIISDTGKGIAPAFLPYLFNSFRQEDSTITRRFGGLGIGLAIVRHLVELHGGTVQAESAGEGQGATFTVLLPLMPNGAVVMPEPTIKPTPISLAGIKLLVVDDDADTRELLAFLLGTAGASVTVAPSAAVALATIAQARPDVLISDIGMPNQDGYELLYQAKKLVAQQGEMLPAIALTAYATETDSQQATAAGFNVHLAKPVNPSALIQAIALLIGRAESQR